MDNIESDSYEQHREWQLWTTSRVTAMNNMEIDAMNNIESDSYEQYRGVTAMNNTQEWQL